MMNDCPPTCDCGNTEDLVEFDGTYVCSECLVTIDYPTEPWEDAHELQEIFLQDFDEEHYLVAAIRKHLLTYSQSLMLHMRGLSIEDCLNGRFNGSQESTVTILFSEWNETLGIKHFGF